MKKINIKISLIAFLIIILPLSVNAIGLGVSPSQLTYNNVLKNGYAQNGVYISTDTPLNLTMFFEMGGEIKDWMSVENNLTNMTISKNSPKFIKIIIQPPIDAANGDYHGTLRIITDKLINPETGIGSAVKAAFMVNIYVKITGDEIKACSGGGIGIIDAEIGYPLLISSIIKNDGNVRINPPMFIDIWDKYQKEIVYSGTLQTESILPTESIEMRKEILVDLDEDQYWAQIKVPECNLGFTQTFNIVEKGGVSDKGELIRVENKPWAQVDEIIPITAVFRNTGQRTVSAKFKGEVLYQNEVVKIIDTDSLDAKAGETISLQTFFRPNNEGQYFVKGKVYFNNKLTGEKGSVINVTPFTGEKAQSGFTLWYVIILLAIAIFVMLILIKKKKKKHKAAKK